MGHYIFLTSTDHLSLDMFIVRKLLINSPFVYNKIYTNTSDRIQ